MVFLVDRKKELIKVKGLQVLFFSWTDFSSIPKSQGRPCWTGEPYQRTGGCNRCCRHWSWPCKGRWGAQGIRGQGKGRADRGGCEGESKRYQFTPNLCHRVMLPPPSPRTSTWSAGSSLSLRFPSRPLARSWGRTSKLLISRISMEHKSKGTAYIGTLSVTVIF